MTGLRFQKQGISLELEIINSNGRTNSTKMIHDGKKINKSKSAAMTIFFISQPLRRITSIRSNVENCFPSKQEKSLHIPNIAVKKHRSRFAAEADRVLTLPRGGHGSEQIVNLKTYLELFDYVDTFMKRSPYITAFVTGALKSSAADYVTQKAEKRATRKIDYEAMVNAGWEDESMSFDWKRNFAFLLYGGFGLGIIYEWILNEFFLQLFGHQSDLKTVLALTAVEVFVIAPFLIIPLSYILNAIIHKTSCRESIHKYLQDVTQNQLLTTYFALFGPIQILLLTYIPSQFRMSVSSFVSFLWLMILSNISAKEL